MSAVVSQASQYLWAAERGKRQAKPWLFENFQPSDGIAAVGVTCPQGVPLAIKIGMTIGAARRRDELTTAAAHARAAFDCGLVDNDVYLALADAVMAGEGNLARRRRWWERIAPAARIIGRAEEASRRPNILHRRRLASAGPMPPEVARHFTTAQLAVLKIVADEVRRRGTCGLSKKEIGDRAKACRTIVLQAMRKAGALGLMQVKFRPMPGRKSLPNLITITDADWMR